MGRARLFWLLGAVALLLSMASPPASAQSAAPFEDPRTGSGVFDEVRLGYFLHDVHFLGGREKGTDVNGELLFHPFISDALAGNLPWYLRWAAQPRPEFGVVINTIGYTNQYYLGLDWTWLVARDLFNPGRDGLTLGVTFGPGFNDGQIRAQASDRKSLGSNLLFRVSGEVGYRIDPINSVSLYLDHISNGGFAKYNDSINDLGLRYGYKF